MKPYIITVAQQKGGAGKSTLAAHLAIAFLKLDLKIALIDIDPQQTLTRWSQIRAEAKKDQQPQLDLVTSIGWKISNEISRLGDKDIIIIDSPPHMETETKSAIRLANLVIVPCQPSPNDLWSTSNTIDIITKENKAMLLVLNRCPFHSKLLKQIEEYFSSDIDKHFLGNRVVFASSMLSGSTAIEAEPNSLAANEIWLLAKHIIKLKG